MKKIFAFFVVMTVILLFSCWPESEPGKIIGNFEVIKKIPQKERTRGFDRATDYGEIRLTSKEKGTIKIVVKATTLYLNLKVGDVVLVKKTRFGKNYIVTNGIKRDEVGYCILLDKSNILDAYQFSVLTRGGDTITVHNVPADIFFNPPDSVFVKKNTAMRIYNLINP